MAQAESLDNLTADNSTIRRLSEWLHEDLQAVNRSIITHMQSSVPLIPQLAGHLIAAGGKRLRPLLTLLAARLLGYHGERHIHLAACVEFIHTATLLHDDVVDESTLRRGLDSANAVWGNQASVLVGDFLFSRAFQMMVGDGSQTVQRLLADTAATIAEGEVNQLRLKSAPDSDEGLYLQVIHGKTAALFAAATAIVALLNDGDEQTNHYQALYDYGRNLGMAFQLIDDVLDYSANTETLGKSIGDDFAEGKVTLPVILAWQAADAGEQQFLTRTMSRHKQKKGDLATMQKLLQKHDCLNKTRDYANAYGEAALTALNVFGASEALGHMQELVAFCLQRNH